MKNQPVASRPGGFALIATLTLMVLLAVLALGLLSLSSISMRSSASGSALSIAEANARMALVLAIGDLQKHAGADTRVTARADILDEKNPPVLGVWKSWEGTDHEESGRPRAPDSYASVKNSRFIAWMTSGSQAGMPDTRPGTGKATLVGAGSATNPHQQIHLPAIKLSKAAGNGAYAWWVAGENMKARLPVPADPPGRSPGQWAAAMKSHSTADPKPFGLDALLKDPAPARKAFTHGLMDLVHPGSPRISSEFFHDISATSAGLLTNAATGGWKKDLSLFTENQAKIGTKDLPLFRLTPEKDSFTTLATQGDVRGSKSVFYPWSSYRGSTSSIPIYQHAAVASWNNLLDYALLYKQVDSAARSIPTFSSPIDTNIFPFLHQVRIIPVIARIQWVYSHSAGSPIANGPNMGKQEARLLLTPVITMWNPYNLEITSPTLTFVIPKPIPSALKYKVGAVKNTKFMSVMGGNLNNSPSLGPGTLRYGIPAAFTLKPGETRIFSPASETPATAGTQLALNPGYRSRGGHYFPLKNDDGAPIHAAPTDTIKAEAVFDTIYNDRSIGVGIYLDMIIGGRRHLAYRMTYAPEVARAVYPELNDMSTSPPMANLATNPSPFMTTVFGARMASRTHIPQRGFVQSSPLVNYTAMGGKDLVESTILRKYRGSDHPVNSPFDYSFKAITANDSNAPGEDATTQRGYIVTGFNKADGLSRCVIAELPSRPLQSLGELQNWDLRYENPVAPFAFNIIGNSDATPLIAADAVIAAHSDDQNLQHDDSYCANHLLFDDWFLSSIAPDPSNFGTSGRDMKTVFADLIAGNRDLPNSAYRPIPGDRGGDANRLFAEHIDTADSWKTVASRIEVEGMFNVNSTSTTAWRAILGHARNRKVPYMKETGASFGISLSGETDHAVSRFSVAGDSDTGSKGSSGAFPGANEFTGYRILDDAMIAALAGDVVRQVRLRGPFLSLSEFVNRQLSSGNLALAGTLQAALDEIAKKAATNPYKGITAVISRPATEDPPGDGEEYAFKKAAVGEGTYGLPGWTRQADILRPLAPILTVRDDTFTIRAYGDARDNQGNVLAKAVCEATVRRTRDYTDPSDPADLTTYPASPQNRSFGRRLDTVSFRWIPPDEV
ncbi:hypothetical protein HZ994_08830 [Akkermansiaceae bacterium]|nr:hypothetical protein HZ994_08830 [Akkermansiaceae bacterium]